VSIHSVFRVGSVVDVLSLMKKMCYLRSSWEEATAGLEKQAVESD